MPSRFEVLEPRILLSHVLTEQHDWRAQGPLPARAVAAQVAGAGGAAASALSLDSIWASSSDWDDRDGPARRPISALSGRTDDGGGTRPGNWQHGQAIDLPGDVVERHVELEAQFDGGVRSMSFTIPIDSQTRTIGLSLHALASGGNGSLPVVKEILLEDGDGNLVAQLGPDWGVPETDSVRGLTVSLNNVPSGGNLIVEVSLPAQYSWGAISSPGQSGAPTSQLPFMMDVLLQETSTTGLGPTAFGAGSGGGGLAYLAIGTLSAAPTSSQQGPAHNWVMVEPMAAPAASDAPPSVDQPSAGGGADAGAGLDGGGFHVRVITGPLVSRSAAPLGPKLGDVLSDPALPVDRHERALAQIEDRIGAGPETDTAGLAALLEDGAGSERAEVDLGDGTRWALAGFGAFPLKVTGASLHANASAGEGVDLGSLLAALPNVSGPALLIAAERPENGADGVSVALASAVEPSSSRTRRARPIGPGVITTVCGLALGLGLTAGPLFPDLLGLFPARRARWRRGASSNLAKKRPGGL